MSENAGGSGSKSDGMLNKLFDSMPAWQRAILLFFIMPPMALAISGVLLQVNVGAVVNRYIDYMYERSKDQTRIITEAVSITEGKLSGEIAKVNDANAAAMAEIKASVDGLVREMSAQQGRVAGIEKRVVDVEARVGKIERYICDSDKALGYGACKLDSEPSPTIQQ